MNLANAKELIERNTKAGVKWIERAYNKCRTDNDIIRLGKQIKEQERRNIERINKSYAVKS